MSVVEAADPTFRTGSQLLGDAAMAKAREMVEAMRSKGDDEGAATWLRIIVAIGTLGEPPIAAGH